ncbi:MAG: DUF3108 domain-containing protein [PVC group bacterium]|nr:DUF3108 domain-containing protein [PVC group bacterium]
MGYLINTSMRRARLWFWLFITLAVFFFVKYSPYMQPPVVEENIPALVETEEPEKEEFTRIGEKILYDVVMGKVRIGTSEYRHLEKTELNGHQVDVIAFFTDVVRFKDRETIYSDSESFLPVMVKRKISRLIKQEHITEEYDQDKFILTITKKRFGTSTRTVKKDKPIHNAILLPFYARKPLELEIGWSFTASLPQREFKIRLASIEEIKIPAGKFKTYYFESEPKQIKIWMSADEHRVPLRIEGTGALGYKMVMREYTPPELLRSEMSPDTPFLKSQL